MGRFERRLEKGLNPRILGLRGCGIARSVWPRFPRRSYYIVFPIQEKTQSRTLVVPCPRRRGWIRRGSRVDPRVCLVAQHSCGVNYLTSSSSCAELSVLVLVTMNPARYGCGPSTFVHNSRSGTRQTRTRTQQRRRALMWRWAVGCAEFGASRPRTLEICQARLALFDKTTAETKQAQASSSTSI